jgi:uncharacterized protein YjiS (DUF1127 family)
MTHETTLHFTDTTVPQTITGDVLSIWYRNFTTRRVLARMDAERLSDIGLTEAQRASEIAKPFWR